MNWGLFQKSKLKSKNSENTSLDQKTWVIKQYLPLKTDIFVVILMKLTQNGYPGGTIPGSFVFFQ